jgi:glutathione S-transferase
MNPGSGLAGNNVFESAVSDQWVAWAQILHSSVRRAADAVHGTTVLDSKVFADLINNIKTQVKCLNTHLKGRTWIAGNHITVADIVCGVTLSSAFQLYLDAGLRKGFSDLGAWFERFVALPEVVKVAGNIKLCNKALKASTG